MTPLYQKQRQFLQKIAELGKIPHALLFYGSDEPGLKSVALEFIALINQQKAEQAIRPDLFFVGPGEEREIKISQIRDLQNKLSLKSYSAIFKTIIVEGAHFLNQEAQSAFLKLLEEPKGKTVFILITAYPEMLLPTILSRVERLRFYSPVKPCEEEQAKELQKLGQADLAYRFSYAKKLADEPQDLNVILETWLSHFRELLVGAAHGEDKGYSLAKLQKIIKTLETTNFLISTTNVSPRLALEILMLEL